MMPFQATKISCGIANLPGSQSHKKETWQKRTVIQFLLIERKLMVSSLDKWPYQCLEKLVVARVDVS